MIEFIIKLFHIYSIIITIEDGLAENMEGWKKLTQKIGNKIQISRS